MTTVSAFLFVFGSMCFGYLAPEILAATSKVTVPMGMNVISALGAFCLSLSYVL